MSGTLAVVTGGAGFIGSHVVDALVRRGDRVVVLDDFSTGKLSNLAAHAQNDHLTIIEHDVSTGIASRLEPYGVPATIFHLAAQVSVVASIAHPLDDLRINYGSTLHVLEYAKSHVARPKVVLASSAAVYGDAAEPPVAEDVPLRPLSPYGMHKLASEFALGGYSATHGVPTAALRFFNVYGPRQDPSSPYSGVISIFADRARNGVPLKIFGDGKQTRDFVYVGDVVRALLAAAAHPAPHLIANVGTGAEITITELARTLIELCGGTSTIEYAEARAGEIARSRARVDRLRDQLGIVAETVLAEGLRATLGLTGRRA
ncbi:MAG TPA: NAD-dependent epimerase/dehydratase family protein [Kofleriaceae bacterium]|jgi:UDP-glucose 4-epimerase